MEIVLNNTKSKYFEVFSFVDLDDIHETLKKVSWILSKSTEVKISMYPFCVLFKTISIQ